MESPNRTIRLFILFLLPILFIGCTSSSSKENEYSFSYPSNELLNDIKSFYFKPKQKIGYISSETELKLEYKELEKKLYDLFYKNKKTFFRCMENNMSNISYIFFILSGNSSSVKIEDIIVAQQGEYIIYSNGMLMNMLLSTIDVNLEKNYAYVKCSLSRRNSDFSSDGYSGNHYLYFEKPNIIIYNRNSNILPQKNILILAVIPIVNL